MPNVEKNIYMIVDKKHDELPLFVGTLSELCGFTGKTRNAILSAIGHAKVRGSNSQYKKVIDRSEEDG